MVAAAAMVSTGTLMMPAETAVSPMMSAPTRLTVWLMDLGARSPASRTISSSRVTASISGMGGSGVEASPWAKFGQQVHGDQLRRKADRHDIQPGPNTASKNARYLSRRMRPANTAPEE